MTRNPNITDEQRPFSFPEWKAALEAAELAEAQRAGVRRAILGFLHECKIRHAVATVALANEYLAAQAERGGAGEREALRWFFSRGKYRPRGGEEPGRVPVLAARKATPMPANQDLGGADWERDLITASRERGFLWRTEPRKWLRQRGSKPSNQSYSLRLCAAVGV